MLIHYNSNIPELSPECDSLSTDFLTAHGPLLAHFFVFNQRRDQLAHLLTVEEFDKRRLEFKISETVPPAQHAEYRMHSC